MRLKNQKSIYIVSDVSNLMVSVYSFVRSLIDRWLIDWLIHSFIHSFIHPFNNSFIDLFVHWINSFVHSLAHSFTHSCTPRRRIPHVFLRQSNVLLESYTRPRWKNCEQMIKRCGEAFTHLSLRPLIHRPSTHHSSNKLSIYPIIHPCEWVNEWMNSKKE